MVWRPDLDCSGGEGRKIAPLVVPYTRGKVLDVGSGAARLFAHWETLDSGMDYGGRRVADHHLDGSGPLPFQDAVYDAVFSSHFLEHCADPQAALREWWRVLKVGGHLVLYVPASGLYPDPGEPGANPDHKHAIGVDRLTAWLTALGDVTLIELQERAGGDEYSLYAVAQKRDADGLGFRVVTDRPRDVLVVRYGGIGDAIWAASIIAGYASAGLKVTVMCDPITRDVLAQDPNVSDWLVQDKGQVPEEDLPAYWDAWAGRYSVVCNLVGLVEGHLLTQPGSVVDRLPAQARRAMVGHVNYLEHLHRAAGLPVLRTDAARFHPTEAETAQARALIAEAAGDAPVVVWALTGSSVHKRYPHFCQAIVRLLWETDAHIFTVGGPDAVEFERLLDEMVREWFGPTDRLHLTAVAGWPVRASLTLATVADVVVGPETGVLNAVAPLDHVAKVVMLSHSSADNLVKHWRNVTVVTNRVPCQPCHRLHHDWSRCTRDARTGGAACTLIAPETMARLVKEAVVRRGRAALPAPAAAE